MLLPGGWSTQPGYYAGQFVFTYGASGNESIVLQVFLDTPANIYSQTLQITSTFDSPKAALEAFEAQVSASGSAATLKWGNVEPVKVGALDGYGVVVNAFDEPARRYEFRIAPLSDGKLVFVLIQARESMWSVGQPILYKMVDSLVVKPENVPTATPTLHPLLMTATALQEQIIALTSTPAR
jgi:hypothetical protein